MANTPKASIRIPQRTLDFLDALAAFLNPDNPSRANAITVLARAYTPPDSLDPLALKARQAHKDLLL
jgi:hypothetical protein